MPKLLAAVKSKIINPKSEIKLPYQILPNLIFIVAILGILIMILRHLPEAAAQEDKSASGQAALKLSDKGLPAMAVSRLKSLLTLWGKKALNFVLEAKDVKPQALAGYRIRKMFGTKQQLPAQAQARAAEPKTEAYFLDAIKKQPKNLNYYDNLGKFYLEQNNAQDALDIYLYLTEHNAANADYHARLAYCYYQLKNFEKTIEHYTKSVALDSSQPNRYYNLGLVLETLGRNSEAVASINQAITLEPNNARYYLSLSNVCLKLGANDQALNALQRARAFDPKNEKVVQKLEKLQQSRT